MDLWRCLKECQCLLRSNQILPVCWASGIRLVGLFDKCCSLWLSTFWKGSNFLVQSVSTFMSGQTGLIIGFRFCSCIHHEDQFTQATFVCPFRKQHRNCLLISQHNMGQELEILVRNYLAVLLCAIICSTQWLVLCKLVVLATAELKWTDRRGNHGNDACV